MFTTFIYVEEGSLAGLKDIVVTHIFVDMRTTFKMSLPPIFLILSNELLLVSSNILPAQSMSAGNYSIIGVVFFSLLVLKKKFFLSQALAVYFIARGLDKFTPGDVATVDPESGADAKSIFLAHFAIASAILCYGMSYVVLEKVLKSSEVSLWIRGIQLNLFTVPLSLLMSFSYDWLYNDSRGFFDHFNIIAWFFIIFKIAQQMMELFVIKVADSIYRCLALSTALVLIGIMQHPFSLEESYTTIPAKLGAGFVLTGICLYCIMDHFPKWGELYETESDEDYREAPVEVSKGYQSVPTVSSAVSNANALLQTIDES